MKERIRQLMDETGLSQQDFAAKIGVSASSLSNIFNGRSGPTNYHVQAIHAAFPDVNLYWLMFGEGSMRTLMNGEKDDLLNSTSLDTIKPAPESNDSGADKVGLADLFLAAAKPETGGATLLVDEGMSEVGVVPPANPGRQFGSRNREPKSSRMGAAGYSHPSIQLEGPKRQIKEIRVFFDDGTYEAFVPAK